MEAVASSAVVRASTPPRRTAVRAGWTLGGLASLLVLTAAALDLHTASYRQLLYLAVAQTLALLASPNGPEIVTILVPSREKTAVPKRLGCSSPVAAIIPVWMSMYFHLSKPSANRMALASGLKMAGPISFPNGRAGPERSGHRRYARIETNRSVAASLRALVRTLRAR